MVKGIDRCPTCGAKRAQYTHSLRSGKLVKIFCKFAQAASYAGWERNPAKIGLTSNEFNNFQKLKYWGIVEQTHRSGIWRVTQKGGLFLRNEIALPVEAITYRGRLVYHHGNPRRINSFFLSSELMPIYQKAEDYRNSAQENKQVEIQEALGV